MDDSYQVEQIEEKWRTYWNEEGVFKWDPEAEEGVYCLAMYPYPSGVLHMGHVLNYTISDSMVRYFRANRGNVLSPMGWDSFGLPAENAAIKAGIPPKKFTRDNIENMRQQIKRAGWVYDWNLELATSHPGYYKWTQWLFLQFYKKGLAFKKESPVNWCSTCHTVLANEQVHQGKCERCNTEVVQKDLNQWFFKMSAYAQRLLDGHKKLKGHWPDRVLKLQKDWIGRSEGARLDFEIEGIDETLSVFTTRPDTTYGVTFMSLAPEHPLINKLLEDNPKADEIRAARNRMRNQSSIERTSEDTEKEGIFTGRYVINPFNGEKVELWIANYALMDYGTGAVMAVPAHDQRDFLFAKKYDLPIKVVIEPEGENLSGDKLEEAYTDEGVMVNSGHFDGMNNYKAIKAMTEYAREEGFGDFEINFRLRDWLLSRQRYWGCPIPMVYCDSCGTVPVGEEDLPVELPEDVDFKPGGDSPLKRHPEWRKTECPQCGSEAERETDTMDTFVDSSWYFFRYTSPRMEDKVFDKNLVEKWLPVDLYIGGIEHATMHLVYARFFTMVCRDLGLVDRDEPFKELFCQGMLCKTAHRCPVPEHTWIPEEEVEFSCKKCGQIEADQTDLSGGKVVCKSCNGKVTALHKDCGREVESEMTKMSKTKKNGVNPDAMFEKYGADTLRLGILRLGPVDQDLVFSESVMVGESKFLQRVYRTTLELVEEVQGAQMPTGEEDFPKAIRDLRRKAHETLQDAYRAFEKDFSFNTLIARHHELLKELSKGEEAPAEVKAEALDVLLLTLSPFAPHLCEELWEKRGGEGSVFAQKWPEVDEEALKEEEVEIAVQINGKIRDRTMIDAGMDKDKVEELVLQLDKIQGYIEGKEIRKVIVVPDRLVNIIV